MTANQIAKLLSRHPPVLGAAGKNGYVVLPMADYRKMCEALEDARDLEDLEREHRQNADEPPIPWDDVKKGLDELKRASKKKSVKRKR